MIVPDKAILWFPKVRDYLKKHPDLIYGSDVVFTSSPAFSNHLSGRFIKSKNKDILWISELRDFHFIETIGRVRNLKQIINRRLESLVIRDADRISFISKSMKEIYSEYYKQFSQKFGVIYNGFDMADFETLDISTTRNDKLTIFYAGSFYRGVRSPIPLLDILENLIENGEISHHELEIRIAGNFENSLKEEVSNYKCFSSINFIGNIPRSEVLTHLVSADLLWLIVGNKSTHYAGVPIKFYEYLGARRPIINFAPAKSEPSRIIFDNDLGFNFDTSAFNLTEGVATFQKIIKDYRAGNLAKSLTEKQYPEFDRKYQGLLFGKLFNES